MKISRPCFRLLILSLFIPTFSCIYDPTKSAILPTTGYVSNHSVMKTSIVSGLNRMAASNAFLIGQNLGHLDGSIDTSLISTGGKNVTLIGVDLGYDDLSRNYDSQIKDIVSHWNKGGLVTVSFHTKNPQWGTDVRDLHFTAWEKIITPGNPHYDDWQTVLGNMGNFLQKLKDQHVIVLWRPFHEMNGDWFWWGNASFRPSPEDFARVWRQMHDYFEKVRKLDNLLWTYSPNYVNDSRTVATETYYPGEAYVDIVGLDYYHKDFSQIDRAQGWANLAKLNKPMGLCEFGARLDGTYDLLGTLALKQNFPASFILFWHSHRDQKNAIRDCLNTGEFMNHSQVVTLDEFLR